jgi:hypothetical protein
VASCALARLSPATPRPAAAIPALPRASVSRRESRRSAKERAISSNLNIFIDRFLVMMRTPAKKGAADYSLIARRAGLKC